MDIRKLQRAIVDGLEDVKAQNIVVFNTEHLSPLFERVIIASGTSNRQTKALAASVRDSVKSRGMQVMRTEGEDNGEWIIVDCGAAVAHIMQPAIRDYYHLEEIWGDKPVRMKIEPESRPRTMSYVAPRVVSERPHAGRGDGEPAHKPRATNPGAKHAAAKKPPAKKAAAKQAAAGRRTAAGKPAAKASGARKAPAKKAPTRTVGVKAAARRAPARQAAAKKTPARKAGSNARRG